MGSHITKPSNKTMVDRLVENRTYIKSASVEGVFRAVDRAMYFELAEGEATDPYDDDPWRHGNLHLSAPCIYAKVVEALDLRPGLSFLNLGSGTGYLNTIIGLLVGPYGINHGIEFHSDVVDYAYKRLKQFKQESYAIDKYDFSEPIFIKGNCINLDPNSSYDRIYLGAACLPDLEMFMKKLIKPNGGILVMPFEDHLMKYVRTADSEWRTEKLMEVNFTQMIGSNGQQEPIIEMPRTCAKSLKELCRISIRRQLRSKTDSMNPSLLHSDNINSRRLRKAKAEQAMLARNRERYHKKEARPEPQKDGCNCRYSHKDKIKGPTRPDTSRPKQSPPATSSSVGCSSTSECDSAGVVTRSASRRLVNQESAMPTRLISSTLQHQSDIDLSIARENNSVIGVAPTINGDAGSISDLNSAGARPRPLNCARARPFIRRKSRSRPLSSSHAIPALPFPLDSSDDESDESHLRLFEEHDYINRSVILNWPAILRIHNSNQEPLTDSDLDEPELSDILLDEESDEGDIDDEVDGSEDNLDDSTSSHSGSSSIMNDFFNIVYSSESTRSQALSQTSNDDEEEENDYDIDDEDEEDIVSLDGEEEDIAVTRPIPSTSSNRFCPVNEIGKLSQADTNSPNFKKSTANNPDGEPTVDLEPVARRLRSKYSPSSRFMGSSQPPLTSTTSNKCENGSNSMLKPEQQDRLIPNCSRDESAQHSHHRHNCPLYQCRAHNGRRCCNSQRPHNHPGDRGLMSPSTGSTSNTQSLKRPASTSSNQTLDTSEQQPSLFSGHVVLRTGIGTTLSLATRQRIMSNSGRNTSLRLCPRHSLSQSIGPARHSRRNQNHRHYNHHHHSPNQLCPSTQTQQKQLGEQQLHMRKRKHHSSSESFRRRVGGKRGQRKRPKLGENECERYHNHLTNYINKLPIPRVLHSYLNYDRNLWNI